MQRPSFIHGFVLLTGLLLLGCSSNEHGHSQPGQKLIVVIQQAGQPVTAGQVDLSGQGGGAPLNEQGEAIFEHVPFGEYQVMVHPPDENAIPAAEGNSASASKPAVVIPKKFLSPSTTPLTLKVESGGEQRFQFDLKQ